MREWILIIVIVATGNFASGCAHTSLYQSWNKQLIELPRHNGRVDDVSLLLGATPTRCEPINAPQPVIGIILNPEKPAVSAVWPNSPADQAGFRPGDSIKGVGGQSVASSVQIRATIQSNAREGQPLDIETSRGVLTVVPKLAKAEQCYWDVQGGQVVGVSAYRGAAYQRFFRASCRIYDGFIAGCQTNWQE